MNFILFNQDNSEPTSVLACFVDFAKAFNRQDHSILVTKLSDMGVPSWLLKIDISFLTNRTMIVRYKGQKSSIKKLPGGGPRGALLGLLLFLVLVNDAGFENRKQTGMVRQLHVRKRLNNSKELEVVQEIKLLGVIIRNDLSWGPNTDYIVQKANKKLWCLRRLKKLGANTGDLMEVYTKQVRSQLELSVPLWHPGLTGEDRLKIERIQKSACCIILGQEYQSYKRALKQLGLDTLHERRNKLCKTFSKKAQKHTKFKKWFKPNEKTSCTRNIPARFCDVYARTKRFKQSPISYLTNILNNQ